MDIRYLTSDFAVAPQILATDLQELVDAGFQAVICNRPAMESGPGEGPQDIENAAKAAGLQFRDNPVVMGQMTLDTVEAQKSDMKTLAYCASGTRSAIVWAFTQAGKMRTEDILAAMASAGYPMAHLAPQLDALASQNAQG